MAFALVQSKRSTVTGTSIVISLASAATAGSLFVLHVKVNGAVALPSVTITDNASTPNTYADTGIANGGSGLICHQFYGVQVTGGATTITMSWTGSFTVAVISDEFTGAAQSNAAAFDKVAGASGSLSPATVSLAPTNDNELIAAGVGLTSASAVTAGSGYTIGTSNANSSSEYKAQGTTSETAPFTFGGASATWNEVAAAYKARATSGFFGFM